MNLFEYAYEAFSALIKNKMRSLLSLLGIVIGIASVVILTGIGDGFKAQMMKSFSATNTMITITKGGQRQGGWGGKNTQNTLKNAIENTQSSHIFTQQTIDIIKKNLGVNVLYVLPAITLNSGPIKLNNKNIHASVTPVLNEYFNARKASIDKGVKFLTGQVENKERVAIVGSSIVKNNLKNMDPLGQEILIGNQTFHIIGILKKTDNYQMDDGIFIPITTAKERMGASEIKSIQVYIDSIENVPSVTANLGYFLMKYIGARNPKNSGFHLRTNEQMLKEINKQIGSASMMISGIAAISLIVGGIGIMNIMLVSVTERTREIGIRKAIGARRRDIVMQFLTEAAVLTLIGGVVAIIISYIIGYFIGKFVPSISPVITMQTIMIAVGFSIFMGIIFGLMPAWKAAKMEPIDALRFE